MPEDEDLEMEELESLGNFTRDRMAANLRKELAPEEPPVEEAMPPEAAPEAELSPEDIAKLKELLATMEAEQPASE